MLAVAKLWKFALLLMTVVVVAHLWDFGGSLSRRWVLSRLALQKHQHFWSAVGAETGAEDYYSEHIPGERSAEDLSNGYLVETPATELFDQKESDETPAESIVHGQPSEEVSTEEPLDEHLTQGNFANGSSRWSAPSLPEPEALTAHNTEVVKYPKASIGKITMLYGDPNPVYESALQTHIEHANRHGYPVSVLRQKLLGRLWSKPAYILSIILNELQKPQKKRLKWLFWFDADTIIINPKIPLELFLPPSPTFDHIHFLCGSDYNGLNDGAFLLRVNHYSLHLLAAALSVESFRPEVDTKYSEQSAIEHVVHSGDFVSHSGESTYAESFAEIPQRWLNAYMGPMILENSVKKGDLLLHFAGHGDTKMHRMTTFMDLLSKNSSVWEKDPDKTEYGAEVAKFWSEMERNGERSKKK